MQNDLKALVATILNVGEGTVELEPVPGFRGLADQASTFIIRAEDRRFVLQLSPERYPEIVREDRKRARAARQVLGRRLGSVIDDPVEEGTIAGRSFAVGIFRRPIATTGIRRIVDRHVYSRRALDWLRLVTARSTGTLGDPTPALKALLAACPSLSVDVEREVRLLQRCSSPLRSTVMHGDFWAGNLLTNVSNEFGVSIIDWRGSLVRGYPIFDLVRVMESFGILPRLRSELNAHLQLLECDAQIGRLYLLNALGHFAADLGNFPMQEFRLMAERVVGAYDAYCC